MKKFITLQKQSSKNDERSEGNIQDSPSQFYSELEILKLVDLYRFKLDIGKTVHAQLQNKQKVAKHFIFLN